MQKLSIYIIILCIIAGLVLIGYTAYQREEDLGFVKGDIKYNWKWKVRKEK